MVAVLREMFKVLTQELGSMPRPGKLKVELRVVIVRQHFRLHGLIPALSNAGQVYTPQCLVDAYYT